MKIWIINQYNMPPEYGHLNRHYNFGKYLTRLGHQPTIFVGSYLHNTNKQMIQSNDTIAQYENADFPYYFVKTNNYGTNKMKRVLAMIEFYRNLMKSADRFEKPDVILGSSAHPLAALLAIKLAKKYKCKSIVEIRDLWPESIVEYGILNRKNPIVQMLYHGEKWLYTKADQLIFTMEGGKDYIRDKGWALETGGSIDLSKVNHVNNGVDLEVFTYNKHNYILEDDDLNDSKSFKVVYAGSIRKVNNVKKIVDVAEKVQKYESANIRFLIYGDGTDRISLERYCKEKKLDNIVFKGHVEKKYIPYILSKADLNILHFQDNNLKKYGVSLNKMFDYFASGKPTISDCSFGYDIIEKYVCGEVLDKGSAQEMADSILEFYKMEKENYQRFCENSLRAAKEYDFKHLSEKLVEICQA